MKSVIKSALVLFIMIGMSDFANAQMFKRQTEKMNSNWNYGIIGGVDFANFRGDAFNKTDSRTFGNVGLFVTYKAHENFLIQPEVLYTVRGAENKVNVEGTFYKDKYRMSYIQVPVYAKGLVKMGENSSIYAKAGPSIAFKIDDGFDSNDPALNDANDLKAAGYKTNDTVFETNFGLGFHFGNIMLGGTYNLGLTDVIKDRDVQNDSFTIHLGIAVRDWHHPLRNR